LKSPLAGKIDLLRRDRDDGNEQAKRHANDSDTVTRHPHWTCEIAPMMVEIQYNDCPQTAISPSPKLQLSFLID
jgi:hypothetical protein